MSRVSIIMQIDEFSSRRSPRHPQTLAAEKQQDAAQARPPPPIWFRDAAGRARVPRPCVPFRRAGPAPPAPPRSALSGCPRRCMSGARGALVTAVGTAGLKPERCAQAGVQLPEDAHTPLPSGTIAPPPMRATAWARCPARASASSRVGSPPGGAESREARFLEERTSSDGRIDGRTSARSAGAGFLASGQGLIW